MTFLDPTVSRRELTPVGPEVIRAAFCRYDGGFAPGRRDEWEAAGAIGQKG
jgi:hypothetical protein